MTFNPFWYIGREACSIATQAGREVGAAVSCSADQYTSMGWIAFALVVVLGFAIWHAGKERRRHDDYLL